VKVLAPRVKNGKKPNRRAQMLGIRRDRKQRFRYRAKQNAINLARILECESADLLRQRKHHMEIGDRQQFGCSILQPLGTCHPLALGAMPVAARVVRDASMTAGIALLDILNMAAEGVCPAVANRLKRLTLMRTQHM